MFQSTDEVTPVPDRVTIFQERKEVTAYPNIVAKFYGTGVVTLLSVLTRQQCFRTQMRLPRDLTC